MRILFFIIGIILLFFISCNHISSHKILHVVPYGYEGSLTLKSEDNLSMKSNKVNDDDYIVIEYKDGIGVLNSEIVGRLEEEKVLWKNQNGEYIDSIQFVNLGIKTIGTETVFIIVRQNSSRKEILSKLKHFLPEEVTELDPNWKPEGGKNQLGPVREYIIKKNIRYWYDIKMN